MCRIIIANVLVSFTLLWLGILRAVEIPVDAIFCTDINLHIKSTAALKKKKSFIITFIIYANKMPIFIYLLIVSLKNEVWRSIFNITFISSIGDIIVKTNFQISNQIISILLIVYVFYCFLFLMYLFGFMICCFRHVCCLQDQEKVIKNTICSVVEKFRKAACWTQMYAKCTFSFTFDLTCDY